VRYPLLSRPGKPPGKWQADMFFSKRLIDYWFRRFAAPWNDELIIQI
jgi:hypothetical protein